MSNDVHMDTNQTFTFESDREAEIALTSERGSQSGHFCSVCGEGRFYRTGYRRHLKKHQDQGEIASAQEAWDHDVNEMFQRARAAKRYLMGR